MALIKRVIKKIDNINKPEVIAPASFYTFDGNNYIIANSVFMPNSNTPLDTSKYQVSVNMDYVPNGINITYTVKNLTAVALQPPRFKLGTNHTNNKVTIDNPLKRIFAHENTVKQQYANTGLPAQFTNQWFKLRGGGNQLHSPLIAFDNQKDTTIGFSSDCLDYAIFSVFNSYNLDIDFGFRNNNTYPNGEMLPHWIKGGDTKQYKFFIRAVKGIGTAACINAWKPFIDLIKSTKPFSMNPNKLEGRIYGVFASRGGSGDSNDRWYETFTAPQFGVTTGVKASTASGFKQYLYALLSQFNSIDEFKSLGYKAIMIWSLSGTIYPETPNTIQNFLAGCWEHLPEKLKNSKNEIKEFEDETGIKVFIYFGYAGSYYQSSDSWNSPMISAFNRYYNSNVNGPIYPPLVGSDDWQRSTYTDEYLQWVERNFVDALNYCSGIGMDAVPYGDLYENFDQLMQSLRSRFPNKYFWLETSPTLIGCRFGNPYYFNTGLFEGRDEVLDAINNNYDFLYQDIPNENIVTNDKVEKYNGQFIFYRKASEIPSKYNS